MSLASKIHDYDNTTAYVYNLGYAHSHRRAENVEKFASWIKVQAGDTRNLVCFTNSTQTVERGFLKELGFTTVVHNDSYMKSHYISKEEWQATIKRLNTRTFLERKRFEARERARIRAEQMANGTLRNKDGSVPRRRGELRVGDSIYSVLVQGRWYTNSYTVSELHDNGEITITRNRIQQPNKIPPETHRFRPVANNGMNTYNLVRARPKYQRYN